MRIAIYSICRNEESEVADFVENTKDADKVTICDTGSTDRTVERFWHACQSDIGRLKLDHIKLDPWSFGLARNTALALVPGDVDVCIRLDLDERLSPGWRKALKAVWSPGTQQLWYDFEHYPGYTFRANYVHARNGFYWKGIDHEALMCYSPRVNTAYSSDFKIIHHQKEKAGRANILGRLELQASLEPCARNFYYLGREYFYYKSIKCLPVLTQCLAASSWDTERMDCYMMMGKYHEHLNMLPEAIQDYTRASLEYATREPYMALSKVYFVQGLTDLSNAMHHYAMTFSNRIETIHHDPEVWK